MALASKPVARWCSATASVGHGFESWVSKRATLTVPSFYFGLAGDECVQEWFLTAKRAWLAKSLRDGEVTVPGYSPPPKSMPQDLELAPPPLPTLNVVRQRHDLYPEIPQELVQAGMQEGSQGLCSLTLKQKTRTPPVTVPVVEHARRVRREVPDVHGLAG